MTLSQLPHQVFSHRFSILVWDFSDPKRHINKWSWCGCARRKSVAFVTKINDAVQKQNEVNLMRDQKTHSSVTSSMLVLLKYRWLFSSLLFALMILISLNSSIVWLWAWSSRRQKSGRRRSCLPYDPILVSFGVKSKKIIIDATRFKSDDPTNNFRIIGDTKTPCGNWRTIMRKQ